MPHKTLLLTLACSLLSACASGPQPTLVQIAPQVQPIKVPPPPNLTRAPQSLPPPASGLMPDLERNHREVAQAFHQLAAQLCGLLQTMEIEHRECLPYLQEPEPADAKPHRRGR